jgi:hypothetical protein
MTENSPKRNHPLREVFDGLRWIKADVFEAMVYDLRALLRLIKGRKESLKAAIFDRCILQNGGWAEYDRAKRKKGGKAHITVDTLGICCPVCDTRQ